ncbi:MAG: lipopolysaccharide biosynthesis protein [Bacteroidales bacterium]|nr:lipopolysaccharide biosynthesis protein [Bacteroidales bacterium]
MDNLKQQGTKAFIWDFFGKMATHGMGFIVTIFLARLLEPSDFGLIALVMVIIGIASVFTDVGLGAALIQRRRLHPIHYSSVFYFNIVVGLFLTLITYFSAPWVSEFYNSEKLLPLVQVMSISFILGALSSVQSTRLRKELNYALLTKIGLISSLISGVIGISLAFWGAGVWSLVAQTLSMGVMYNLLIWTAGHWKPTLEFSWKALMQLWGFGFRMFLSGMLDAIFTRIDFLIIGKLFPPATLGYFQRAKSLNSMVIQYSSGSLMAVLFPVLSKVQNDLPRFQNIIMKSLGIISFIVFLLLGGLYLVSEELIVLLFSDKWLPSVDFFKILVLSGFAYPLSALLVNVLSSRGNSKAFLRLEIYKKLIASVNFLLLYYFGIHTFLYGLIVQAVLAVSLNILFASREINLPFYLFVKPIIVQMSISLTSVVFTVFLTQDIEQWDIIMLMIKGSIFTFIYVLLNYTIQTTSFKYFLEQIIPVIKKKFGNKVKS